MVISNYSGSVESSADGALCLWNWYYTINFTSEPQSESQYFYYVNITRFLQLLNVYTTAEMYSSVFTLNSRQLKDDNQFSFWTLDYYSEYLLFCMETKQKCVFSPSKL